MAWKSTLSSHSRFFILLLTGLLAFGFTKAQNSDPNSGPGGPILVIGTTANPFSRYTAEILRAEGFNEFSVMDISAASSAAITNYDVIILGEMPLTTAQVSMLEQWTNAGGTLIAFKPDTRLASLLGLITAPGSLTDKYLLVNTSSGPGTGIVNKTIQFHGSADYYKPSTASILAILYSTPTTPTIYPAVTLNNVGTNGGKAVAFTYDLLRSIVYTRQGNPAWAGQKRDGTSGPIRSDDLFFGGSESPDWVDLDKVDIPQADEQQRLLGNIIIKGNLHRKPLPRFWFLPRGLKAAVVMTGDDHANNGTEGRFNLHTMQGPNTAEDVAGWKAVRGSSYMWLNTPISNADATALQAKGFELALHMNTQCQNFTPASFAADLSSQLAQFANQYPGLAKPVTHRTHCLVWSDWASAAKIQAQNGIRLDVNYYYWPDTWVQNRSGMFTGSGMPMRFADEDGSLIDCYQVTTQMTDESGLDFAPFINQLLDKAKGPEGYYGVFCANMHTDSASHIGANTVIASAQARGIPVVSAKQMLTWLDGRNNSSFRNMSWVNNQLSFDITAASGSFGLKAMLPVHSSNGQLSALTAGVTAVPYYTETIKGIPYVFFDAGFAGKYTATYTPDTAAPVLSAIMATPNADNTASITWTSNETSNSTVVYGLSPASLDQTADNNNLVTSHSVVLTDLAPGTTYYFRVSSVDAAGNSVTAPLATAAPLQFTMAAGPCLTDQVSADFLAGSTGQQTIVSAEQDGAVILKPLLNEEFSGTTLSSTWGDAAFAPGGVTAVSNGSATVSGSHIFSNATYGPGTAIEFTATFRNGDFQNIGFTTDQPFDQEPWVTFGQGFANGTLYARTSAGANIELGSGLIGSSHRYLLKWNTNNFEFYVDGAATPAATIPLVVSSNMHLQISDFKSTDGVLSVDWMRVTPYASSGVFNSRVVDAGATKKWEAVTWNSETPAGTSISIAVRTGNTASPDASWTPYTTIANQSVGVNAVSRYIQYKAELTSSDNQRSPSLKDLTIYCTVSNGLPVITLQPLSQTICVGAPVIFTTAANAGNSSAVQWQVSTDGVNWNNLAGATNAQLSIAVVKIEDNGKQYRAAWSNSEGIANSAAATLTVQEKPELASRTTATATSGVAFTYTPSGTAGSSYSWTRAVVTGISNAAASGSGAINETLVNTGTVPVAVTYIYTLTKNSCTSTTNVVVTVNAPGCDMQASVTADFNRIAIAANRRIWFNSVFKPSNLGNGPVNFTVTNSKITYVLNGQTVVLPVPNATIRFASNISFASTKFVNNAWVTEVPLNNGGNAFLTGLAYVVPQSLPSSGLQDVTWTADIHADKPGVTLAWKWSAAVYSSLGTAPNLSVRPVDNLLSILSPIVTLGNAGTVQNYTLFMIPGAMGSGLLNITAVYSAAQNLNCTLPAANIVGRSSASPEIAASPSLAVETTLMEKQLDPKLDAVVSPNPGTSQFALFIKGDARSAATVTISDQLGRVMERHEKVSVNSSLLIGHGWKGGTYFAEIRQGDQRKIIKIVKLN